MRLRDGGDLPDVVTSRGQRLGRDCGVMLRVVEGLVRVQAFISLADYAAVGKLRIVIAGGAMKRGDVVRQRKKKLSRA